MNRDQPILIFGDVMLDVTVSGGVKRMSPEAPDAPVLLAEAFSLSPGGAANVALCVEALGGRASLIGAIGNDPPGAAVDHELAKTKIDTTLLAREDARTTTKVRIVSSGKQMMRIDSEDVALLSGKDEQATLTQLLDQLPDARMVLISDYGKGMVTPMLAARLIMAAAVRGIPVAVDSKTPAAKHYLGATVVKPNLIEIGRALDRPAPETDATAAECAQALRRKCGAACVVLTRGERGLCLAAEPGEMHFDPYPVEAVDPTGAGDAVLAATALAMAGGAGIVEAARFGNAAGAVAVSKLGTVAPTFEEVSFFYDCRPWRHHEAGRGVAGEPAHGRLH